MQTHFSHIQFNIRPENMQYYRDLMAFLGWRTMVADDEMLGVAGKHHDSLWFSAQVKEVSNDYDGPGMNHIGIGADSVTDVDTAAAYLSEQGVKLLFETPRHRPEFSQSEEHTYYQVMFETPDRILVEIVYIGPKAA